LVWGLQYSRKNKNMKKITLVIIFLLILGLPFASQILEMKKIDTPVEKVVIKEFVIEENMIEEEVQLEEWMITLFK